MIQILSLRDQKDNINGNDLVTNTLRKPQSLDEFEVNIIMLDDEELWTNKEDGIAIDLQDDLLSISKMIENSEYSKIIIVFPQNVNFRCFTRYGKSNEKIVELKYILDDIAINILSNIYKPIGDLELLYEPTKTKIDNSELQADFYFNVLDNILAESVKSIKPTIIKFYDITLSTLKINTYEDVNNILTFLKLKINKDKEPKWIKSINMFDDLVQLEKVQNNSRLIDNAKFEIDKAQKVINRNNEYKSVLYTNGDELVKVVFNIFTKMFGCDLTDFKDTKKEDFLFEINRHVFIGEIKGVTHNIKNENISQLDVHYQSYIDDHKDIDMENISAILIMNHQKNKPISDREPVHQNQVNLAIRNGSLIIESITLLKVFEKYFNKELTRQDCIDLIINNTGLLKI